MLVVRKASVNSFTARGVVPGPFETIVRYDWIELSPFPFMIQKVVNIKRLGGYVTPKGILCVLTGQFRGYDSLEVKLNDSVV